MAKQVNVVITQLLIQILVLDLLLEETEDALDHNGKDLVLDEVLWVLQLLRSVDTGDVSDHLEILRANVCHQPPC